MGGLLTPAATTALHHKEFSFVCSDKGKTSGFRRLPPACRGSASDGHLGGHRLSWARCFLKCRSVCPLLISQAVVCSPGI